MNSLKHPWTLAIFACRETLPQLLQTLEAARVSAACCTTIHVLVNGNPELAKNLAQKLSQTQSVIEGLDAQPTIRVWSIALGDKANAWNQYIHNIWANEEIAFFIDGYVRLNADAVELLGNAVANNDLALGGTGVPTVGRSAKAVRENLIINPGLHGNLCCIKGKTINQMRDQQIRLPIGLYRTDSLMGAILCYGLAHQNHVWDNHRIHVLPTASWQIDVAKWWRVRDINSFIKRYFRQVRGKLENAALKDHLSHRRCSPAELPAHIQTLILEWIERCPGDFKRIAKSNLFTHQAMETIRHLPKPSQKECAPVLL